MDRSVDRFFFFFFFFTLHKQLKHLVFGILSTVKSSPSTSHVSRLPGSTEVAITMMIRYDWSRGRPISEPGADSSVTRMPYRLSKVIGVLSSTSERGRARFSRFLPSFLPSFFPLFSLSNDSISSLKLAAIFRLFNAP